jgi:hypothetical protein
MSREVAVMTLHPDRVDTRVRSPPAGQLLELLDDVRVLLVVDDRRRAGLLLGHAQPVVEAVDRDDLLGTEQLRAGDGELTDRAGAPDGNHLAALDVAELGAHVARREDVRQEQHLFVAELVVLDLDRPDVRERDACVLRLAARVAAGEVRVAVDPGDRVTEHLLRRHCVRIRVLTERVELVLAVVAAPAGDRERHDDAIALLEVRHSAAGLDDLAHELVAEDVAALHRRHVAVVEVQVRAADGCGRDPHDHVLAHENLGVGNVLDLDGVAA